MVDTTLAVEEIKSNSQHPWVKECKVPQKAGGVTDALIGIQYDLIHPEPIHSLPNGLTLYKSKLAPHEPGFNAAIGGPHTSFDFCCNAVGGAHRAVALFAQQIELYKSGEWSAPRITTYPMTREELTFAKDMAEFGCDLDTLNKVGSWKLVPRSSLISLRKFMI